jgi:dTMP kinase
LPHPPFLSLDGVDGAGKSTQLQLLAEWLRSKGWSVVRCADPGGTPLGDQLREILLSHRQERSMMAEALLFMGSRAELLERVIRPALAAGSLVLCDRFLLANVVYQGYAGGLNVEELWQVGRLAAGGMEPDLTLVLDLPLDAAQQRRGREPDRMESRQREFHERVQQGFLTEARMQPERIRVIDASGPVAAVHAAICAEVERVLAAHPRP